MDFVGHFIAYRDLYNPIKAFHLEGHQNWLKRILNLIFGYFYLPFMFLHINVFCHALLLIGGQGILLSLAAYMGIARMTDFCRRQFANRNRKYLFTPANLTTYLRRVNGFLVTLADANRVYGLSLFAFILLNMPLNALLIRMLSIGQIAHGNLRAISGVYVFIQLAFIFAMTTFFAKISLMLHAPVRDVMGCSVEGSLSYKDKNGLNLRRKNGLKNSKNASFWRLAGRLKLSRYIETFHTREQFTVKYGSYGSVTFGSLGKVRWSSFTILLYF